MPPAAAPDKGAERIAHFLAQLVACAQRGTPRAIQVGAPRARAPDTWVAWPFPARRVERVRQWGTWSADRSAVCAGAVLYACRAVLRHDAYAAVRAWLTQRHVLPRPRAVWLTAHGRFDGGARVPHARPAAQRARRVCDAQRPCVRVRAVRARRTVRARGAPHPGCVANHARPQPRRVGAGGGEARRVPDAALARLSCTGTDVRRRGARRARHRQGLPRPGDARFARALGPDAASAAPLFPAGRRPPWCRHFADLSRRARGYRGPGTLGGPACPAVAGAAYTGRRAVPCADARRPRQGTAPAARQHTAGRAACRARAPAARRVQV